MNTETRERREKSEKTKSAKWNFLNIFSLRDSAKSQLRSNRVSSVPLRHQQAKVNASRNPFAHILVPIFFHSLSNAWQFQFVKHQKKTKKKKSFSHKVRIFPLKRRRRKNQKNKISRVLQEKSPNRYTKLNDIQTYFGGNKEGEISEEYKNWKLKEKIISKRSTCVWMVGVASA